MNLNILAHEAEQIELIVQSIAAAVAHLLKNQNQVTLAVSGGKSPIKLFNLLSQASLAWEKIIITLVDERVTDVNSEDSNENLVRTHLLKNNAAKAKFHGLTLPQKDMPSMITNANQWVNQIDIAILGMGEDGHTASIFPECPEFNQAIAEDVTPSYIETNPLSAKYKRIGLNLNGITRIKYLILSINGELKLKIVQEAIKNVSQNYPISYLFNKRPDVQIFYFE